MCCLLSLLVLSGERRLGKIRLGVIKPNHSGFGFCIRKEG